MQHAPIPRTSATMDDPLSTDSATTLAGLANQHDVLFVLVDMLAGIQAFRTLASLTLASRAFKEVLQAWMEKTKERIVVDLEDLAGLGSSKLKFIQYVVDHQYRSGLSA